MKTTIKNIKFNFDTFKLTPKNQEAESWVFFDIPQSKVLFGWKNPLRLFFLMWNSTTVIMLVLRTSNPILLFEAIQSREWLRFYFLPCPPKDKFIKENAKKPIFSIGIVASLCSGKKSLTPQKLIWPQVLVALGGIQKLRRQEGGVSQMSTKIDKS